MDAISGITTIGLTADVWTLISDENKTELVWNKSPVPVQIYRGGDTAPTEDDIGSTPRYLGGFVGELISKQGSKIWAKALGKATHLQKRDITISADIPQELVDLYDSFIEFKAIAMHHMGDFTNPHQTDGLDEFLKLFDIVHEPDDSDVSHLASTVLTNKILTTLQTHKNSTGNVHNWGKDDLRKFISLNKVPNFSAATDENAADHSKSDVFITPKNFHDQFNARVNDITINAILPVLPQIVLQGRLGEYAVFNSTLDPKDTKIDWFKYGVSRVPKTIHMENVNTIVVRNGLCVSYAHKTEICVSNILDHDITYDVDVSKEGTHYIFAVVDEHHYITGITLSKYRLRHAPYSPQDNYQGYTFDTGQMTVFDKDGNHVRVVCIGIIDIQPTLDPDGVSISNSVVSCTPTPVGHRYVFAHGINPGERKYLKPMYCADHTKTSCKVIYKEELINTGWDDGVGVYAEEYYSHSNQDFIMKIIGGGGGLLKSSNPIVFDMSVDESLVTSRLPVIVSVERSL